MSGPNDAAYLDDLLTAVRAGVVADITAVGLTAPDLRYNSIGTPAWDCPQVAAYAIGLQLVQPGTSPDARQDPRRVAVPGIEIGVTVIDCVTTLTSADSPPDEATRDADSARIHGLAWAAWRGQVVRMTTGSVFALGPPEFQAPDCNTITQQGCVLLRPQANLAGFQILLKIQL